MAIEISTRLWAPFRALQDVINACISRRDGDGAGELEAALRRHKADFMSLLKPPAKNAASRDLVSKASVDGIQVQGLNSKQKFSKQFVAEALIISDLFNVDELAAVELLMAGENQLPNYPGLTRGLVAVILFYDGQRSLVSSLRSLLQAREGHRWTLGLSTDVVQLVMEFTDQLMAVRLVHKILDLIQDFDPVKQLDTLNKQRGLGGPRHKKQVTNLLAEIKQGLAECLFCVACQQPLDKEDTVRLLTYLRGDCGLGASQIMQPVTLCLLMTLLACFDTSSLDQDEEDVACVPIVEDANYLREVHNAIKSESIWLTPGILATVRLSWGVFLRRLSQCQCFQGKGDLLEEDELLIDQAMDDDVFGFLQRSVVAVSEFHTEEFYVRGLHRLIADFIVLLPLKVTELRSWADEAAQVIIAHQSQNLDPPPQRREFHHLMELIGDLYHKDPLKLELCLEYWCPVDATFDFPHHPTISRQVALFKFVRQSGDVLPAPLFTHYIHMLVGLAGTPQSAQQAFNILKANSSLPGVADTVSWDHFFQSLQHYFTSMRHEVSVGADVVLYGHPVRAITPLELDGICHLLQLTTTVANQSEVCRGAFYENQHWAVLVTLFGLLGCGVPVTLKREILLTLAAMSRTPAIAATVWQMLEASQILPTVPAEQKGGIHMELEELESRNEKYPMTRAFLVLLNRLLDIPVPPGLGVGLRVPGFEPYLDFIVHSVLLKFGNRAYKDVNEKWEMVSEVLEVLLKLLQDHVSWEADLKDDLFQLPSGSVSSTKRPGFTLLVHMLNDSPLFRTVMKVLVEGMSQFSTYLPIAGQVSLERSTLLCLQLLVTVAERQTAMEHFIRRTSSMVMITSMDKLLLGVNQKTRRPDYLITIARFVIFNNFLWQHTLAAVTVLQAIGGRTNLHSDLTTILSADTTTSRDLLHGFVECLESDYPEESEEHSVNGGEISESSSIGRAQNATRQRLIMLLLKSLSSPSPNLAYWLLGFQVQKSASKTNLQDPGIMGQARTCLHSVLNALQQGVDRPGGPSCLQTCPRYADLCYQLVYVLCSSKETSAPTLRYLRSSYNFLFLQLQHVPFAADSYKYSVAQHQSWLLRTAAVELRLTALNRQRSHCHRLVQLMIGEEGGKQNGDGFSHGTEGQEVSSRHSVANHSTQQFSTVTGERFGNKLLSILHTVNFSHQSSPVLHLSLFNQSSVESMLGEHKETDVDGVSYYDVRGIRRVLMNELGSQQGALMSGQLTLILEEIDQLLAVVVERNRLRQSLHRQHDYFEAWRQVVEVIFIACPEDLITPDIRQVVLCDLLQDLLSFISEKWSSPQAMAPASDVVLMLAASLRQSFLPHHSPADQPTLLEDFDDRSGMDSVSGALALRSSAWIRRSSSKTLFATSLQVVLKGLIEFILNSRSGPQKVRTNLYGALLFYLQIAEKPTCSLQQATQDSDAISTSGGKDSGDVDMCKLFAKECIGTLSSFGDSLMDVICRDACDGHDIGRMLSLSVLDSILRMEQAHRLLSHLVSHGYLRHLVDGLPADDAGLHDALAPSPTQLRSLYIFQTKMSVFTRIARTVEGATSLLQCGLTRILATCSALSLQPYSDSTPDDIIDESCDASFVPDASARYRMLLSSVLRLCLALLTSLGTENREAAVQVMLVMVSHSDVFSAVLHTRCPCLSLAAMTELALTTAVISRAGCHGDLAYDLMDNATAHAQFRSCQASLKRYMLALFPRFCFSDKFQKRLDGLVETCSEHAETQRVSGELSLAYHEIASNIITFCRSSIDQSSPSYQYCHILFGPSLEEATARELPYSGERGHMSNVVGSLGTPTALNLGLVVYELKQCVAHFSIVSESLRQNQQKLASVRDMTTDDLKHLTGQREAERLSSRQRQELIQRRVTHQVVCKSQELQHISFIMENCLFILWRHMQYYLLRCVPPAQQPLAFQAQALRQQKMRRLQDASWRDEGGGEMDGLDEKFEEVVQGVLQSDLTLFKDTVSVVVTEALLKKVLAINEAYSRNSSHHSFVEVVIRRIRRLIRLHACN